MERLVMRGVLLSSVLLLAACDGDASGEDAGATMDASAADAATDDAGMVCARSSECDDGLYCNGEERCEDAVCVDGESPCDAETERCVEDERTCATLECDGPEMGDYDGDGHAAMACGGDDCDDEDPNRYPGNEEVCDTEDHDEDCDPTTYGFRDADSDGEPDASCCNEDNCGTDCDDMRPGVNPTVPEVCGNDRDDDCDDMVDENLMDAWADADSDGYGDSSMPLRVCPGSGEATMPGDCDESDSTINPGESESCNHVDNDCDGSVDEGVAAGECSVVRTPDRCVAGDFVCRGNCTETDNFAQLGATTAGADTPPGIAYLIDRDSADVDLARATEVVVDFRVGKRAADEGDGTFGVVFTPTPVVGPEETAGFVSLPGGLPELTGDQAGIAAFGSSSRRAVLVIYGGPSITPRVVTAPTAIPSCGALPLSPFARRIELRLRVDGPDISATLEVGGCGSSTATTALGSFDADIYGDGPNYPTYFVGAVGDSDNGLDILLERLELRREASSIGERGNCEPCPSSLTSVICLSP